MLNGKGGNGEKLSFMNEREGFQKSKDGGEVPVQEPWLVMIVDDDEAMHAVTELVLDDFELMGKGLELLHAYSGEEARRMIEENPQVAVMFLDVVMETENEGLDVTKYIREELKNKYVRIILRTGQPGSAPEHEVVANYDINDYREKSDLTSQKLITSLTSSLRAYSDLRTIEKLIVEHNNLENVMEDRLIDLNNQNHSLQEKIKQKEILAERLKDNQDKLISIIDNTDSIIYLKDMDGKFMLANSRFQRIIGCDREDVVGKSDLELHAPGWVKNLTAQDNVIISTGQTIQQEQKVIVDGEVYYFLTVKFAIEDADGCWHRVCNISTDITDLKRTEQYLKKLSKALENTADIVVIANADGVIEYVNPAFEKVSGYHKSEIEGKKTIEDMHISLEGECCLESVFSRVEGGEPYTCVCSAIKKDGSMFYEEITFSSLKDECGKSSHLVCTGKELDERSAAA